MSNQSVIKLFEKIVISNYERIAVRDRKDKITYGELNEKANRFAHYLLEEKKVKKGDFIAISMNRNIDMMITLLGILKAGCTYIPVDRIYPKKRIDFILNDSRASACIVNKDSKEEYEFHGDLINYDENKYRQYSTENCSIDIEGDDGLYMTYTSGSTGIPKGVLVWNKSILNLSKTVEHLFDFSEDSVFISMTTMTFDIFVFEALLPLLRGASVVIASHEDQGDIYSLVYLLKQVTVYQSTPSRLAAFLQNELVVDSLKNIKTFILGGEPFPMELLKKCRELFSAQIWNGYGPTECSVYTSFKNLTDADDITIGKPVQNSQMYVLDEFRNECIKGELYIGGACLAKGYWSREELNKERFITGQGGNRLYKSGDIVIKRQNGEFEYVGRADYQVKIRGYRIELQEIEEALKKVDGIKKAIVDAQAMLNGEKTLCAYCITSRKIEKEEIINRLAQSLPEYMIPLHYKFMDSFPLNANGKIDRKAFPLFDFNRKSEEYVAPRNEIEEEIAQLWQELLNYDKISIFDDFIDYGGNSLTVVQMAGYLYEVYQIKLSLASILTEGRTIADLAALVEKVVLDSTDEDELTAMMAELDKASL